VEFGQVANDCQSEAQTAVAALDARIRLPEAIENEREELGADAFTAVGHGQFDLGLQAL
jgi:hypothetical protein